MKSLPNQTHTYTHHPKPQCSGCCVCMSVCVCSAIASSQGTPSFVSLVSHFRPVTPDVTMRSDICSSVCSQGGKQHVRKHTAENWTAGALIPPKYTHTHTLTAQQRVSHQSWFLWLALIEWLRDVRINEREQTAVGKTMMSSHNTLFHSVCLYKEKLPSPTFIFFLLLLSFFPTLSI